MQSQEIFASPKRLSFWVCCSCSRSTIIIMAAFRRIRVYMVTPHHLIGLGRFVPGGIEFVQDSAAALPTDCSRRWGLNLPLFASVPPPEGCVSPHCLPKNFVASRSTTSMMTGKSILHSLDREGDYCFSTLGTLAIATLCDLLDGPPLTNCHVSG